MPLIFNVTKEDMLRSKTVEPGWYKCLVKNITQEAASTDGSTLAVVDLVITQDGPYNGVPLKRYFSEKAPGFTVPFFGACGATIKEEGAQYDFDKCKGRTILVYIKNDMYQNRLTNKAEDFKSITA